MAAGEPNYSQRSPSATSKFLNGIEHRHLEDPDISDVEDLKESLKNGLIDARRKITFLRKELKETQESLDQERVMRETAEKEQTGGVSMNGYRGHSTPTSPASMIRSNHITMMSRSPTASPTRGRTNNNSSTPNLHIGNMESMIEELKAARLLNRTLTEKLSQAEQELDEVLLSKDEMEVELEASVTARGAALVDKLYTAQKVREEAMTVRMKLLIDEKEELYTRIRKLEKDHGVDSGVETGSGALFDDLLQHDQLSLNEVLNRLSSTNQTQAIDYHGDTILERLNQAQASNQSKTSDDSKQMKTERDNALKEVEILKEELQEVHKERELYETQHRKNEKNRLKAIQNQLKGVIRERDEAVERSHALEEETEKIRLQFSLKNSLSQEENLKQQFNTTLNDFEAKLFEKERELSMAQQSYDELVTKMNVLAQEKSSLQTQLEDARLRVKDEQKRAERSERLVEVLRKRKTISISDTID